MSCHACGHFQTLNWSDLIEQLRYYYTLKCLHLVIIQSQSYYFKVLLCSGNNLKKSLGLSLMNACCKIKNKHKVLINSSNSSEYWTKFPKKPTHLISFTWILSYHFWWMHLWRKRSPLMRPQMWWLSPWGTINLILLRLVYQFSRTTIVKKWGDFSWAIVWFWDLLTVWVLLKSWHIPDPGIYIYCFLFVVFLYGCQNFNDALCFLKRKGWSCHSQG